MTPPFFLCPSLQTEEILILRRRVQELEAELAQFHVGDTGAGTSGAAAGAAPGAGDDSDTASDPLWRTRPRRH